MTSFWPAPSMCGKLLETEALVVDVDDTVEADQKKLVFVLDKEKASLNGINTQQIASTVRLALEGHQPGEETMMTAGQGVLHLRRELNPLRIVLRAPLSERSSQVDLERLTVSSASGDVIQIGEFGHFEEVVEDKTIYHKNLQRVVYVFAEMAGRPPAEAVLSLQGRLRDDPAPHGVDVRWAGEGEWKITLDVFRDLGIAFGAACLGIYILLIWQTNSYGMPLLLMVAIPLTIIGILPGFWLLNLIKNVDIGGYPNPGVLHGHRHDWHDRLVGFGDAQCDPADRVRPRGTARRKSASRCAAQEWGRSIPPDFSDGGNGHAGCLADHAGPGLLRPRLVADLWLARFDGLYPGGGASGLLAHLRQPTRAWPAAAGDG